MSPPTADRTTPPPPAGRVLVIDDSPTTLAVIGLLLESMGWETLRATSGQAGLDAAMGTTLDVVVCDLHMSGMGGLEVIQRMRHLHPALPVIVLSSDEGTHAILEVVHAGAFDYVLKTTDIGPLVAALERASQHHRVVRENRRLTDDLAQTNQRLAAHLEELQRTNQSLARTEERLRQSNHELAVARDVAMAAENHFKTILAEIPVGIAILDLDKTYRWANREALSLMGVDDLQDLLGRRCEGTLCEPDHSPRSPSSEPKSRQVEVLLRRFDGSALPILRSMHLIELGEVSQVLLTFVDLTEQKRLEAEFQHLHKLEAVGQLAAGIAHEINTPTQYVGDSIQFLAEAFADLGEFVRATQSILHHGDSPVPPTLLEQIREAEERADLAYLEAHVPSSIQRSIDGLARISSIVSAMKDFSNADACGLSPVDLNEAVKSVLTIAENAYKHVADVVEEYGPIPLVRCHLGDINQVLLNLLMNAVQAISEVGGTPQKGTIRIKTSQALPGTVSIEISDTGSGIPLEIQKRIFDPFFTTRPVGKGVGQGLTIAHKVVVDRHGGALTFSSIPGAGSTFVVQLPVDGPTTAHHGA